MKVNGPYGYLGAKVPGLTKPNPGEFPRNSISGTDQVVPSNKPVTPDAFVR